jgi:broad specificity phosphatase PhoE
MKDQYNITRFGMIRHAQTVWNQEKRIQGQSDSPLSEQGQRQAAAWGHDLKQISWSRILASDSGRALATAERINASLKVPLAIDSRLKEQNWGQWEGKTVRQIEAEAPQLLDQQIKAGWDFCPPRGESRHRVLTRCQAALQEAAERYAGQILLVVTHEGVVKALIYHLYGRKYLAGEPVILKSYQLHWLVYRNSRLQIEKINAFKLGS